MIEAVHRAPISPLPTKTAHAAKSIFNIENVYLSIGDQLEDVFGDLDLDALRAFSEKPAGTTFVLAMVTIFQFAEDLPDRRAAEALRSRMDWKYALHLPLNYRGLDPSELMEFRQRLSHDTTAQSVLQIMLSRLAKLGLVGGREKRERDAADVLTAVDSLSRVDRVAEAMSVALEVIASEQPDWLLEISLSHWYERYNRDLAMRQLPLTREEQEALAEAIGADMFHLLEASSAADAPDIALTPELRALRRLLQQEFDAPNHLDADSSTI